MREMDLELLQETGVRTDLQRNWFHPINYLPEVS